MTKRRMIHDDFFQSEGVADWSIRQRLLVIGLIALADDQGRLKGNPFWVKAHVFPYDEILTSDIDVDLAEIESRNDTIIRYEVDGRDYIQLTHWWDYQNLQWAKPSDLPAPEEWSDKVRQMVYKPKRWIMTENWPETADRLTFDSCDLLGNELGNKSGNVLGRPLPITNTNTNTNINTKEYAEMRSVWAWQFPKKPQPRKDNKTLQGKIKTRLKSAHFKENWRAALIQAGKSELLAESGWFDFGWFVKNDDNYEKCLNGNYDNRRSLVTGSEAEREILAHIKKYGVRQAPKFNGATEKVMMLAGGYRKLCQMKQYDAIQAIRNASKGVTV